MQTSIPGIEKWGSAHEAAAFYKCSLAEILRWATVGLVPAHHLRSTAKNGSRWWFPIAIGRIAPANVRIREKYVSA